jgi:hypothetical protein
MNLTMRRDATAESGPMHATRFVKYRILCTQYNHRQAAKLYKSSASER